MRRLSLALLVLFAAACATTPREPEPSQREGRMRDLAAMAESGQPASMLPSGSWWHEPRFAGNLDLTADQISKLDGIGAAADPEPIRRESADADRAMRNAMTSDPFDRAAYDRASALLVEARGRLLSQQMRAAADAREVLTAKQWDQLQQNIAEMRAERFERRRGEDPRGMGPRRPGYPPRW